MTAFNEYQGATGETAVYPRHDALPYLALGLANEAGEVAGKYKKYIRGDYDFEGMRTSVVAECGDVLWYLARLLDELDYPLEKCAIDNLEKLLDRKQRGKLKGDGDAR